MHLCYIDESGSTGTDLSNPEQPVFLMAGLLVSDEKWRKTEAAVSSILKDAFRGALPDGFELHAADLLSPEGQGHFAGWDRSARNALALSLLALPHERHHQVFIQQAHKSVMATVQEPNRDYGFEWKHPWDLGLAAMFTMFEEYLRSNRTGSSSTGMVLIDHEDRYLDLVRERSRERRAQGGWRELRKVTEIGYSAVSHANPMIQLVDLIAFTMRKHAEADAGHGSAWPPEAHAFLQQCRDQVWPRVEFKMLRFKTLNVPSDFVGYLKAVRKAP